VQGRAPDAQHRQPLVHRLPADCEDEVPGYDESGEFGRRPWSKAFEAVFIYSGAAEIRHCGTA
jgi:hypothetical protein